MTLKFEVTMGWQNGAGLQKVTLGLQKVLKTSQKVTFWGYKSSHKFSKGYTFWGVEKS